MWLRDHEEVGPSPIPDHLYAKRQLPVQHVLFWLGRSALALGVAVLILAIFIVSLYRMPDGKGLLFWFSDFLPLPAVRVNSNTVTLKEYRNFLDGWHRLYESKGVLGQQISDEIGLRVDDQIVRNVLINELMRERDLILTDEQVDSVYSEFVEQYQTEAHLIELIDRQFGWSQEEFISYVVEPIARMRLLAISVQSWTDVQQQPRDMITGLHAQVFTQKDRFSEIAQEVSTSLSASDGGELGLRPIGEYPVEVRSILSELEDGDLTKVIELDDRFVIYKMIEQEDGASGVLVNARELSVDKRSIFDVLKERLESADIEFYIK